MAHAILNYFILQKYGLVNIPPGRFLILKLNDTHGPDPISLFMLIENINHTDIFMFHCSPWNWQPFYNAGKLTFKGKRQLNHNILLNKTFLNKNKR